MKILTVIKDQIKQPTFGEAEKSWVDDIATFGFELFVCAVSKKFDKAIALPLLAKVSPRATIWYRKGASVTYPLLYTQSYFKLGISTLNYIDVKYGLILDQKNNRLN